MQIAMQTMMTKMNTRRSSLSDKFINYRLIW